MKKRIFSLLVMLMAVVFAVSVGAIDDGKLETAADIKELMDSTDATVLGGTYTLMADIDMSSVAGQSPIGTRENPFTGTFEGNGYMIVGINLVDSTTGYWGFFSTVSGATIKNLTLDGYVETSGGYAAGFVGFVDVSVTMENCINRCTVLQKTSDIGVAGGIVGMLYDETNSPATVVIKNCVNYGDITAYKQAAGIVGRLRDTYTSDNDSYTITGCSNYGTITGGSTKDTAGGIVGCIYHKKSTKTDTTVEKCYNAGTISGGYQVGGIVGCVYPYADLTVETCVNTGSVTALNSGKYQASSVGGIIGSIGNNGGSYTGSATVKDCFNGGDVTVQTKYPARGGMIYGYLYSTAPTLTNNYYSAAATITSGGNKDKGTAIAAADLGTASKYPASFAGVFLFSEDGPYSATSHNHLISLKGGKCVCSLCGTELLTVDTEGYIELSKAADILLLMTNSKANNKVALGYKYRLTANIDLMSLSGQYPIGWRDCPFTGTFDGNGKTVEGIYLVDTSTGYWGFFGKVSGATIQKLTIDGHIESSKYFVGGIVGLVGDKAGTTLIEDCVNYCTVIHRDNPGEAAAGGIVGVIRSNGASNVVVTVRNCVNYGEITAVKQAGGIVARIWDKNGATSTSNCKYTITGCSNYGPVTCGESSDTAGGIAGTIVYVYNSEIVIEKCYNAGEITGGYQVGGILGVSLTYTEDTTVTIDSCINTGAVHATRENEDYVTDAGGIVGTIGTSDKSVMGLTTIRNCFNGGNVSTEDDDVVSVGQILGSAYLASAVDYTVGNYYATTATVPTGGNTDGGEAILAERWCILYGWASDSANLLDSTHAWDDANTCLVCGVAKCVTHTEGVYEAIPSTCVAKGEGEILCSVCYEYIDKDNLGTVNTTELTLDPDAHTIGWDLEGNTARYGCLFCDGADTDLANMTNIYVSAAGDDVSDGLTADTPVKSYTLAQGIAAKLNRDFTIYLIGEVAVENRTYSTADYTLSKGFEEAPHKDYTITVTSADTNNKGTLVVPEEVTYYHAYGPLVFENLNITGTGKGDGATDSASVRFFARGFEFTMGEGITIMNVQGEMTSNKTDSGIDGFGVSNVKIPRSKVYVFGGFQYGGLYEGASFETFDADLTVLSGAYWVIAGGNFGMTTTRVMDGATIDLTIGKVTTRYLAPINFNTETKFTDVTANVHYKGAATIVQTYRLAYGDVATGSGNVVNHFFYSGFAGTKVGDFDVGSTKCFGKVNMYYATEVSADAVVKGYIAKDEALDAAYPQSGEYFDFPVWCYTYGEGTAENDGHTFNDSNVCTFCGITKCDGTNHRYRFGERGGECILGCDAVKAIEALYVSDAGNDANIGTAQDKPLKSYALAQEIAAGQSNPVTIYLVGTVTLENSTNNSKANTIEKCFEEAQHSNLITVTSVSTSSKATLVIPYSVQNYFLYGPVTFKNIKISGNTAGSEASGSANVRFFARGFKLTMDTGVAMANVGGSDITVKKTNAGIDGFGATVTIPNSKVYVFGGFLWNGSYDVGEDTFNKFTSELVVNSGEYWAIVGGNYNTSAAAARVIDGAEIHVTVGKVEARYISPIAINSAATVENTTVEMHYTAKVTATQVYRFAYGEDATGSGNAINHFFDKGAAASAIGDFGMGSTLMQAQVNMYYADALKADALILGYQTKDEKFAVAYNQTGEILPYSEYCVRYLSGHTLDANGVCTFCEVAPCVTHSLEWKVLTAATCDTAGEEAYMCTKCATIDHTRPIEKTTTHDATWSYTGDEAKYICSVCGQTLETKTLSSYTVTDGALHVSATGSANATGTENDPINDFGLAMQIAAQQGITPVTIYVHDSITIYKNGDSAKLLDYVEPVHDNKITITSYGDTKAVLRFDEDRYAQTMSYNLSGTTEFSNIEFSAWRNTKDMWIVARHHNLTLGEGISIDYQRRGADSHAPNVFIVGGCYGIGNSNAASGSGCNGASSNSAGANLTIKSGTYTTVYGGTYKGKCCRIGDIYLNLLGDVTLRRAIIAGNYGSRSQNSSGAFEGYNGDSGHIHITINGHISTGNYFAFTSAGNSSRTVNGTETLGAAVSKQVTLTILGGSIITENFRKQTGVMPLRMLGTTAEGEFTTSRIDIDGLLGDKALTIIVDMSNETAVQLYEHLYYSSLTADPSQNVVNGSTPVEEEEESDGEDAGTDEGDPEEDEDLTGTTTAITTNAGRYTFIPMVDLCGTTNGTHVKDETVGALQGTDANGQPYANIPATCLVNGLQAYQCVNCGKAYYEEVVATGHALNTTPDGTTAATCNAPAMEKYICQTAGCGVIVYKVAVENGQESTPLDGTLYAHHSDPEKTGSCQLCGKDLTVLCDHKNVSTDTTETAKTTAPITSGCATGTRTTCAKCGWVELNLTSTGDGHNYGKYTVTQEPTATEAGIKTRTCKGCGKVDTALINASGDAINAGALALNADGGLAGFDVESSKLSRVEKAALNALLQENAYGSEIKISYETDGVSVTGITYNIPVPAEYTEYKNVMIVVKDDDGNLHFVDFKIEKGYIVFEF